MGISSRQVLAVGDSDNDIGMLRAAALSFAYQPKSERVSRAAKKVLHTRLDELLRFVPR